VQYRLTTLQESRADGEKPRDAAFNFDRQLLDGRLAMAVPRCAYIASSGKNAGLVVTPPNSSQYHFVQGQVYTQVHSAAVFADRDRK